MARRRRQPPVNWHALVDALDDASDQPSLIKAMVRAAEAIDLPIFSYLGWPEQQTPLLIATYAPEWRTRFLAERYERIDPIGAKAQVETLPFFWSAEDYAGKTSTKQRQMFDEAKQFGLTRGITVPLRQTSRQASTLTFATDEKAVTFAHTVKENQYLIHLLGLHFDATLLDKLKFRETPGEPVLSARETACLYWAAQGKSTYETALILRISRRTVVFYLENVRKKFAVTTTRQAIVEAMRRGLVAIER